MADEEKAMDQETPCDHEFQWHPLSDDFGVCSLCGFEADGPPHVYDTHVNDQERCGGYDG